ncbi:hypothetical protein TNCV_4481591 [Trichonephila clavipes]|nr:hypothetical protein TNCV_4481591 [Trichonephila clavipes]
MQYHGVAGIMINGRTRLHVVANGTMTGQRYIDEVLLPHDCLDSEGIQRLVWPARSPDLNPIENVWDALGRQVVGRNYPPTNKNTLIRALTEQINLHVDSDEVQEQLASHIQELTVEELNGRDIEKLKFLDSVRSEDPLTAENDEESVAAFAEKLNMKDACYMLAVARESDPVDDETDEDENNNDESSKAPSNVDTFSALEAVMEWYEQQSECCPTQLVLLKRI